MNHDRVTLQRTGCVNSTSKGEANPDTVPITVLTPPTPLHRIQRSCTITTSCVSLVDFSEVEDLRTFPARILLVKADQALVFVD